MTAATAADLEALLEDNSPDEPHEDAASPPSSHEEVKKSKSGKGVREKEKKKKKHKKDHKKSRKRKRKASRFIDEAASEGSESEDDENDEEMELEKEDTSYIDQYKQRTHFFEEGEDQMSEEQLAKKIEEKYKKQKAEKAAAAHSPVLERPELLVRNVESSQRFSLSLLPKPSDPKVFAVKCRPGMARSLVARLVNKCYAYRVGLNHERKKVDLGIISVFAADNVKEWVYIEAYRQIFVENACNGLEGFFRYRIVQVNQTELIHLMEQQSLSKADTLKNGGFARMRAHPYKNDLCQVVALPDGKPATVKLIPREDYVQKPYVRSSSRKGSVILPQKLFVPSLAVGAQQLQDRTWIWGDLRFDEDGYLLKNVSHRGLIFGSRMMKPSLDELVSFCNNDKAKIAAAAAMCSVANDECNFNLGDPVKIFRGQLAGTIGKIVDMSVSDSWALLRVRSPGMEPIEFRVELSECTKYFAAGTHIWVENGPHAGESGTVVFEGEHLKFLHDRLAIEVEVSANDCKLSQRVCAAASMHGAHFWNLFDLVLFTDQFGAPKIGMIVRITTENVTLMCETSRVVDVHPSVIKQVIKVQTPFFLDQYNNQVFRGKTVDIVGHSRFHGLSGVVQQFYGETVFVVCSQISENAGAVAVPKRDVQLQGGRAKLGLHLRRAVAPYNEITGLPARIAQRSSEFPGLMSAPWSRATVMTTMPDENLQQ